MSALEKKSSAMSAIARSIDIKNNFTREQMLKLNLFIREDEYSDSCFAFTDNDTNEEKNETEKELYEAAKKELARISQPQLSFSLSMANIYAIDEFRPLANMFRTGNFITVGIRDDYFVHARLLEISVNYDEPDDFSVTFGNIYKSKNPVDIHSELLKQTSSVSHQVANSSSFWQKSSKVANDTMQIIKNGLGTAVEQIRMSDNQDVTYDRYGIHLRKKADGSTSLSDLTADGYYKKQAWITNEKFMYTSDGWVTAKSAFGTLVHNGQTVYGLIADIVLAGIVQGSEITGGSITGTTINNGNGTFKVTEAGKLTASGVDVQGNIKATSGYIGNGTSGFTINSTSIYNGLSSLSGTSSGIYIGTDGISLGGGKFKVTKLGKLSAADAVIEGNINAVTGYIGSKTSGFTINSASIYNGLSSLSGTSNGIYIGTDGISLGGGKFKVTKLGKLSATGADIQGTVNATSGTFNGTVNATSGTFNTVTINGSTWTGGNVNSASVNSPTMSGGSYSNGNMYGCTIPTNDVLHIGDVGYLTYLNTGSVVVRAGGIGDISLRGSGGTGTAVTITGGSLSVIGNLIVTGSLLAEGDFKQRVIKTKSYGKRGLNAYETPLPTFSDYGKGKIAADGFCFIEIDPVFSETVVLSHKPVVFLTKYGQGDVWVDDDKSTNTVIVVSGTPGLSFAWETRYLQTKASNERLITPNEPAGSFDYENEAYEYLLDYERKLRS